MAEIAFIKERGKTILVAGIEPEPQHLAVKKLTIGQNCADELCHAQVAAFKLAVNED